MAAGNTFGKLLSITLFGESHGVAIGAVIDGFPAGVKINFDLITKMLAQRMPADVSYETARNEQDNVEFLSGINAGVTIGSPIAFIIRNNNYNTADYDNIRGIIRPGHADFAYSEKYGIYTQDGGGRASGRETAARVVAGALALDFLRSKKIDIVSFTSEIGDIKLNKGIEWVSEEDVFNSTTRCPDAYIASKMESLLRNVFEQKDSIGGKITSIVKGLPVGVGEPVFYKINTSIAQAVMSIPGSKGVSFGEGFDGVRMRGSEYNDQLKAVDGKVVFSTNHSGGVQGGLSNSNNLIMNTVFRPASSIGIEQNTIDVLGKNQKIRVQGRHDACFVPRVAIVITSMVAVTILDLYLQYCAFVNIKKDENL